MAGIIKSLLDNDLYKFSMQAAVFQLYPRPQVEYKFINRGGTKFPSGFAEKLHEQVDLLCELRMTSDEIKLLRSKCPYLSPVYLDWLRHFRFRGKELWGYQRDGDLFLKISGPWYQTIFWEIPLMAIISELYFQDVNHLSLMSESAINEKDRKKAEYFASLGVKFADFGTRRRFSALNHDKVVASMKDHGGDAFVGTSNFALAMKHGLKPIGTHAHEWFMFHAAKYGFRYANEIALERWVDVFQGDLGIALSDTFTSDNFFKSFGMKYAKLFDGVRHDSGDPIEFAKKAIAHYRGLGIDPMSKTIVFSDGLNIDTVARIADFCKGKIGHSYGIGTNLTNDVGVKPLNMVIKMTGADPDGTGEMIPTVKLSDVPGKHTGDPKAIELCKATLGL